MARCCLTQARLIDRLIVLPGRRFFHNYLFLRRGICVDRLFGLSPIRLVGFVEFQPG
jgi:hypothetical protein